MSKSEVSAAKHTPGPWTIFYENQEQPTEGSFAIDGPDGSAVVLWETDGAIRNEADARLIAAAPELLDALVMAQAHIAMLLGTPDPEDPFADQIQIAVQKQIREAIAKATGSAQ